MLNLIVANLKNIYLIVNVSLLDQSRTSSSWLGLLNRGSLRAAKPSVCKLVLTLAFLSQLNSTRPSTCLYYFPTSTCFRSSSAYLHRCIS